MENNKQNIKNTTSYYWAQSLNKNRTGFIFIMGLVIGFGGFYSFGFIQSWVPLIMIGEILNAMLMFCVGGMLFHSKDIKIILSVPEDIITKRNLRALFAIDFSILTTLIALILFKVLDNVFFKLLITVIVPILLLLMQRVLFSIIKEE